MHCHHCGVHLSQESIRVARCRSCGELVPALHSSSRRMLYLSLIAALMVILILYFEVGGQQSPAPSPAAFVAAANAGEEPFLPPQFALPANFGDIGPRLIAAGAIDPERFIANYARSGQPLTAEQLAILNEGSDEQVVIDHRNAYFLLNFFWALGLTNSNAILTEGPVMMQSNGDPSRLASVGGWTLGKKPAIQLYASARLVDLSEAHQHMVQEVAENVYRPCCDNHTAFADCNHGMALLGLLQFVAAQGASSDALYDVAKNVSAYWFPQQARETAIFFEKSMDLAYADVDPRLAVGKDVFSASGFRQVHEWLVANNALPQPSDGGNSCGV